jgi:N-acetyl-anhydromuramoyl-L-alanine amidase
LRIDAAGRCDAASWVPSPNFDERPDGARVELVVIHNISLPPGEFDGPWIDALFQNCLDPNAHPYFRDIAALEVSAHFLIRRDGEVRQYVSTDQRAWHAGVSTWKGRERCNDFSVGIELEGADDVPFSEPQYEQLESLVGALVERYGPLDFAGHSDVAPGRKTDPGPWFDWDRFRASVT